MRFILLMATLVIVALLVLKGYPGSASFKSADPAGKQQPNPIDKANHASQMIEDTANRQKQAIENQLQ